MERTISISMGKGSLNHNNRNFVAKNVDKDRITDNVIFIKENLKNVYHLLFDDALREYNDKQKRNDRKISDYYEKIRQSKQEKLFYEVIVQIGNKDDMGITDNKEMAELAKTILSDYIREFQERNPHLHVFNAVLHMDEATPHLHIDFVPFIADSRRGLKVRNTLKGALEKQGFVGEGRRNSEWSKWAESEKQALADVMERYKIRWKQLGTKNEHLSVYDFKKKKRKEEVQELDRVIDAKNKEITDKEEKNVELARDISEKKETIDKIDVIIHDKELDVTAVQILKDVESEKLDKLSIKRREVEETIVNLNTQVAEVRDEIGQLGDERSAIKDEIDNMSNRKDNLTKKLDDLEFERFSKEFYIAGLKDENEKMQKEINNKQAVLDEIETEIVSKQNSIDELKEEIRRGENELEGMVDGLIEAQEESEKCKKELAGYHDEMSRIERENQRMIYKENELNSPEWSLAKPARFMSAMDFFQNVALPLVEKLKNVIRSLYREVIALRNKVKEVDDYYEYKEKTTEYVVKLRMENEQLKQTQDAYENVKTAIGEEELKRLENIGRQQRLGLHVVGEYGMLDKVKRR